MNNGPENDYFVRLLVALQPWLEEVVIIGGWAHRLYRLHLHARQLHYTPLMTIDADIAVPPKLAAKESNIGPCLSAKGFHEEFLGEDRPPAVHYRLAEAGTGFYAEFLTPLTGSE